MASIDAQSRGEFYEALTELNRTVTIVAVSHDMMILSSHVKSVACVNRDLHYHDSGKSPRRCWMRPTAARWIWWPMGCRTGCCPGTRAKPHD
jgi:energy-coupling factor transporter ATP-binding protein EcfA2